MGSLKLSNDLSPEESYRQYRALNLFKRHLNKGRKYNFGDDDNLMLNQFLDLNYVQMGEFSHLDERSKSKFIYKLLKLVDYTTETRDFLLDVGGYTDAPPTWKGEVEDGEDSNFIRKRRRPNSPNSLTESKMKAIEPPPTDFTNDEIRMIRRNAALLNDPFDAALPKIRNERSISHLHQRVSNEFANVAHRWRSFAEHYKKNWNAEALIFREEEEEEAEIGEEGEEIRVVDQEEEEEEEVEKVEVEKEEVEEEEEEEEEEEVEEEKEEEEEEEEEEIVKEGEE